MRSRTNCTIDGKNGAPVGNNGFARRNQRWRNRLARRRSGFALSAASIGLRRAISITCKGDSGAASSTSACRAPAGCAERHNGGNAKESCKNRRARWRRESLRFAPIPFASRTTRSVLATVLVAVLGESGPQGGGRRSRDRANHLDALAAITKVGQPFPNQAFRLCDPPDGNTGGGASVGPADAGGGAVAGTLEAAGRSVPGAMNWTPRTVSVRRRTTGSSSRGGW
jgi:hypothetical protein